MSTPEPLTDEATLAATVHLFSTIAHPARLRILLALRAHSPQSVGELQVAIEGEQSATSHHLRVLRDARLVAAERSGRRMLYRLQDDHVTHIIADAVVHVGERDHAHG